MRIYRLRSIAFFAVYAGQTTIIMHKCKKPRKIYPETLRQVSFVSVDKLLNVTTKLKGAWTLEAIDIQYELKKLRITQKSIARELGVSEMTVSKVIRKQIISNRVMRSVSRIINKDYRAIFPEYYSQGQSWIMDFKGGPVFWMFWQGIPQHSAQ